MLGDLQLPPPHDDESWVGIGFHSIDQRRKGATSVDYGRRRTEGCTCVVAWDIV